MATLQEAIIKLEEELAEAEENCNRWKVNDDKYHLSTSQNATEGHKGLERILIAKRDLIKVHLYLMKDIRTAPVYPPLKIARPPPPRKQQETNEISFVDDAMQQFEKRWNAESKTLLEEMDSTKEKPT